MFLVDREGWEWIVALWREIAKVREKQMDMVKRRREGEKR